MTIPYWPDTLGSPARGLGLAPVDVKATFDPEVGESISRPRTTGAPFIADSNFIFIDDQVATFETFYADTLSQGTVRFAMWDVTIDALRMFRFMGVYSREYRMKNIVSVSAKMMRLPGIPWFATYALDGSSRVPAFVADYGSGVYGIGGVKTSAAALPSAAGTFLVRRATTAGTTTQEEAVNAGDITEAQPSGTFSIVGWPL